MSKVNALLEELIGQCVKRKLEGNSAHVTVSGKVYSKLRPPSTERIHLARWYDITLEELQRLKEARQ